MADRRRLDQILQSKGRVSDREIREALDQQSILGGKLGEHLMREGGLAESDLVEALSEQFGLPGVCLDGHSVDAGLFEKLPLALAEEHLCLPIRYISEEDTLEVAFADPSDSSALEAVSAEVRPGRVTPVVAAATRIQETLRSCRQAEASATGEDHDPIPIERVLDLLELAMTSRSGVADEICEKSVWVGRLAEEIAVRLRRRRHDCTMVRLAALVSSIGAWSRQSNATLPLAQLLTQSASAAHHLGLSTVASILEACAGDDLRATSANIPASVIAVSWGIANTRPTEQAEDDFESWEAAYARADGKRLDPAISAVAFSILRQRSIRQRLGGHMPEVVLIGSGPFAQDLQDVLRRFHCRTASAASWKDGMTLIARRRPDVLCILSSGAGLPPGIVLEGQIDERKLSLDDIVVVYDSTSVAGTSPLEQLDVALTLDGSMGAIAVAARIRGVLKTKNVSRRVGRQHTLTESGTEPVVAGRIDDLNLGDLVQLLSHGRKNAHVIFRHHNRQTSVWFENGQVVSADSGHLSGNEAFFELLGWSEGRFEVHPLAVIGVRNIKTPTTALLLEGFRRLDEDRADGPRLTPQHR
jgi:hypothetical protein